jgi:DNA (cytosine-5)-methyltransferase 1
MNYYNEIDPKAAAWLRELIKQGLIPDGIVDERSITEIKPNELKQYTQCHFFAGIGGWSLALQLANWPATRPVWTGSCPCQPFSSAGKQLGDKDERHLWPIFFDLIRECRPECVFGEQVANAIGKGWLDGISADLEGAGYACGATVLGAHSVRAPHIRQRLFWVADATGRQREQCLRSQGDDFQRSADDGATGGLAHPIGLRTDWRGVAGEQEGTGERGDKSHGGCATGGLADSTGERSGPLGAEREGQQREASHGGAGSGMADAFIGGCSSKQQTGSGDAANRGRQIDCKPSCSDSGVGDTSCERSFRDDDNAQVPKRVQHLLAESSKYGGLANAIGSGVGWRDQRGIGAGGEQVAQQEDGAHTANQSGNGSEDAGAARLANSLDTGSQGGLRGRADSQREDQHGHAGCSGADSWSDYDIVPCGDGKTRRIEPGSPPLANGIPARVVRLRGYGNAIVPQVAAEFVQAFVSIS